MSGATVSSNRQAASRSFDLTHTSPGVGLRQLIACHTDPPSVGTSNTRHRCSPQRRHAMDMVTRTVGPDAAPAGHVSPVSSHNEWDPLEEVIVGRLEGATTP